MSAGEDLAARLRRLRHDGERGRGPGGPAAVPLGERERRLLDRRRGRRAGGGGTPPGPGGASSGNGRAPRVARKLGPPAGLAAVSGPLGPWAGRARELAGDHRHGAFRLDEVDAADPADFALVTGDAALAGLELRRAVYLDVETTGLSGGAGTTAFLVALGSFTDAGFELWQGFLQSPGEERALLAEVARRIGEADAVVSFFGKSFDRHRLEDKMRVHGVAPPFAARPHLDLYHPLRRLYGAAFPDARLATMERALCGLSRENDLSGRHAPEAWFDFLAGRAHALEAVFRHNADDVLSLVTLAAHLGRTRAETRASGAPLDAMGEGETEGSTDLGATRAAALARLHAGRREREDALAWCGRALELVHGSPEAGRPLRLLRAELLARLRRVDEAERELEALATRADACAVRALAELAKLLEHRRRDRPAALAATERALAVARHLSLPPGSATRDLRRRHRRLARTTPL